MNKDEIIETITNSIDQWTDEEVLEVLSTFLGRVDMSSQFGETSEGVLTHLMLVLQAGESAIVSNPMEFEWPLQRMPMPDALRGKVN